MGRDKGPVCFLPPAPQKGQLPQHKGSTVRLGPPASGGRVEGSLGPEWQSGEAGQSAGPWGTPRSQNKPGLPPVSVLQRNGRVWGQLGFSHLLLAGPSCQVRGQLCIWALHGRWPKAGRVLSPCSVTHTLTSSSSSASANSKVFACTVRGTEALLPAWGAPNSSSRLSQEARTWGGTSPSSCRASFPV